MVRLVLNKNRGVHVGIATAPNFHKPYCTIFLAQLSLWDYHEGMGESGVPRITDAKVIAAMTHPVRQLAARCRSMARPPSASWCSDWGKLRAISAITLRLWPRLAW